MNALSPEVLAQIAECAREADTRPDVRAVVIYGGEKLFAAGADIKAMAQLEYEDAIAMSHDVHLAFNAVAAIRKPVIAAITGYALGGGCELALACDLRVAAEDATLGQPEVLLGIIPGGGGTQRLPRLIGPSRAKDLIFTGRFVGAQEALSMGLVDRVVPAGDVLVEATALAARLAAGSVTALKSAKETIDNGLSADLTTGLELERAAFAAAFATRDQKRGMVSFIEHGPGKADFS